MLPAAPAFYQNSQSGIHSPQPFPPDDDDGDGDDDDGDCDGDDDDLLHLQLADVSLELLDLNSIGLLLLVQFININCHRVQLVSETVTEAVDIHALLLHLPNLLLDFQDQVL